MIAATARNEMVPVIKWRVLIRGILRNGNQLVGEKVAARSAGVRACLLHFGGAAAGNQREAVNRCGLHTFCAYMWLSILAYSIRDPSPSNFEQHDKSDLLAISSSAVRAT